MIARPAIASNRPSNSLRDSLCWDNHNTENRLVNRRQAEQHKQNAEQELALLNQEIQKMKREKSDLIDSIKETIRDRLGQIKK